MPNFSLIFARTLDDAHRVATIEWQWEHVGEMHNEYRRPDTGERARFYPDNSGGLLRWMTRVYLVPSWTARTDADDIRSRIDSGFFVLQDPTLPEPRKRVKRDEQLSEMRRMLSRLEAQK